MTKRKNKKLKKNKQNKKNKNIKLLDVNKILLLTLGFIGKKIDDKGNISNKKNRKLKGIKVLPDGTYFDKKRKRLEDRRRKNPFGKEKKIKEKIAITAPKRKDETEKEFQQRKRKDDIINISQDNPIAGLLFSNFMTKDYSEYSGKSYSDTLRNIMAISEKLQQDNLTEAEQKGLAERLMGVVKNISKEQRAKTLNTNQGRLLLDEFAGKAPAAAATEEGDGDGDGDGDEPKKERKPAGRKPDTPEQTAEKKIIREEAERKKKEAKAEAKLQKAEDAEEIKIDERRKAKREKAEAKLTEEQKEERAAEKEKQLRERGKKLRAEKKAMKEGETEEERKERKRKKAEREKFDREIDLQIAEERGRETAEERKEREDNEERHARRKRIGTGIYPIGGFRDIIRVAVELDTSDDDELDIAIKKWTKSGKTEKTFPYNEHESELEKRRARWEKEKKEAEPAGGSSDIITKQSKEELQDAS